MSGAPRLALDVQVFQRVNQWRTRLSDEVYYVLMLLLQLHRVLEGQDVWVPHLRRKEKQKALQYPFAYWPCSLGKVDIHQKHTLQQDLQ